MKRHLPYIILVLLAIIMLVGNLQAQPIAKRPKFEYALMLADLAKGDFTFVTSNMYGLSDAKTDYESTRTLWAALEETDGVVLIDYLAIMGGSGFELVDVEWIDTRLAYHFKRPL